MGENLRKSWYRLDQFSLIRGFGGFAYAMPAPTGDCETECVQGLTKLTGYMKIKQPFYHRRHGNTRLGKDYTPSEIWENGNGLAAHTVSEKNSSLYKRILTLQYSPIGFYATDLPGVAQTALRRPPAAAHTASACWAPVGNIAEAGHVSMKMV